VIQDQTEKYYEYDLLKKQFQGCLLQRYISSFEACDQAIEKKALGYGTEAILEALRS
jgi:hypothetical protein